MKVVDKNISRQPKQVTAKTYTGLLAKLVRLSEPVESYFAHNSINKPGLWFYQSMKIFLKEQGETAKANNNIKK